MTCSHFCERGNRIEISDGARGGENFVALFADLRADLAKDARFEFGDALLRVADERFVLFEFERDEAFGVGERLLARVAFGDEVQVRLGYFDVVPEDLVVTDPQTLNACPRTLALLHLREIRLAVAQQLTQAIKLFRETRTNDVDALSPTRQLFTQRSADRFDCRLARR